LAVGPGSKLGPYEVTGPLGAGGMGEVWRARDPRLGRDVAIKVLPAALAGDPERLARFERESRLLASLNHPQVASVLGLEDAGGVPALVMELVEGPTLAERLAKDGALAIPEALALARQVAEAVEYAHERGIVHRDLKPGNVKITPEGAVKVLDFGLAKALASEEGGGSSPQVTQSPTMSVGTQAGVLLGTAAYMAPEQARGKAVDRRADIWAFGVVLFEMLTGRQLFAGETVSDTIARILERQPEWGALPARTPRRVIELLHRCLEKDAKQRLRDMGDARIELDAAIRAAAAGEVDAEATPRRGGVGLVLALAAVALAAFAGGLALRGYLTGRGARPVRLSIVPPAGLVVRSMLFSVDRQGIDAACLERGAASGSAAAIYRRRFDGFEWRKFPGTEGTVGWDESLDGRWVYFVQPVAPGSRERQLLRVPVDGSAPPAVVLPWSEDYAEWDVLPDGRVVIAQRGSKRFKVVGAGATGTPAWKPLVCDQTLAGLSINESLDDGKACLVVASYYQAPSGWTSSVGVLTLESGRIDILVPNSGSPRVTRSGRLLLTRNGTLLAAGWDAHRHRPLGAPSPVLQGLRTDQAWAHARVTVSPDGALGYVPGAVATQGRSLAFVHPDGRVEPWGDERRAFERAPAATPDGRRVAEVDAPPGSASYEIILLDRGRAGTRRLAFVNGEDCTRPLLSPDGRWVAWVRQSANAAAGLYLQPLDGSSPARRLLAARSIDDTDWPQSWYPDGRSILVETQDHGRQSLRRLTLVGDTARVDVVLLADYDVGAGALSPDGRRLAYVSSETGEQQVMVAPIGSDGRAGDAIPVSRGEGWHPQWTDGGATLLWATRSSVVMSARISPSLEVAPPLKRVALADDVNNPDDFTALPNGDLLIVRKAEGEDEIRQFDLVLNFDAEVERVLAKFRRSAR
jgi:serine/threonine-protein kinase